MPRVRDVGRQESKRSFAFVLAWCRPSGGALTAAVLERDLDGGLHRCPERCWVRMAPGLSAKRISRLKEQWVQDYDRWRKRDLSQKRYVYVWADGVYCNVRFDDARLCLLVLMGAIRADGKKELIAVEDGYRESEQSWWELLRDLHSRGSPWNPNWRLEMELWASGRRWPKSPASNAGLGAQDGQRAQLPADAQPRAKQALHQIWMAETRQDAYRAFDEFLTTYQLKFPRATACLAKDREELLAFYDFPAEHWPHLRTTNPSSRRLPPSSCGPPRSGCLSRQTMLTMVFKLCLSAEKRWRRLQGYRPGEVIENGRGVREDEIGLMYDKTPPSTGRQCNKGSKTDGE